MVRALARYVGRHHLALLALFLALGGTSVAAANYINGLRIKPHSLPQNRLTDKAIASLTASEAAVYCAGARARPRSYLIAPCRSRSEAIDDGVFGPAGIAIAIGTDGNPVVAYNGHPVRLARCNDSICAGGRDLLFPPDDNVTEFTGGGEILSDVNGTYFTGEASLAIGTDGNPVMSVYSGADDGDVSVTPCNDPSCAGNNETGNFIDGPGSVGRSPSIAIGTNGNPVVSYYDVTNGNLKVARCNDRACAGSNETVSTVDSNAADIGQSSSIAIGTNGNPVVSYFDVTNGNLKVARCNDPACAGGNETISTVDSTGNVGQFSSLAIGRNGNPVIGYYDITNGNLKVAHCNDRACAGGNETRTAVDRTGDVGQFSSLAIGLDGNPAIGYYDATNANLKVARCNDPACAGSNERLTTADTAGDVGQGAALAIGFDGLPVVAYWDATNNALKVGRPAIVP